MKFKVNTRKLLLRKDPTDRDIEDKSIFLERDDIVESDGAKTFGYNDKEYYKIKTRYGKEGFVRCDALIEVKNDARG